MEPATGSHKYIHERPMRGRYTVKSGCHKPHQPYMFQIPVASTSISQAQPINMERVIRYLLGGVAGRATFLCALNSRSHMQLIRYVTVGPCLHVPVY